MQGLISGASRVKMKIRKLSTGVAVAALVLGVPMYASAEDVLVEMVKAMTVEGYVEAQYNHNFNDPLDQLNAYRAFDYQANTFTFNMAEVSMTKEAGDTPGFGLVLNYGLDTALTASVPTFSTGEIDVQQAYVAQKLLGGTAELQFGKYATLAGAEVIEGPENFNISRSYLFFYTIPFTHTGLRVAFSTPVQGLSVTAGVNNGWDEVQDPNKGKTGELQFAFAPSDMLAAALTGYYGPESTTAVDSDNRGVVDVVATIMPTSALTVVFNYDRGSQAAAGGPGTASALWQGYALYLNVPVGEKNSVTLRGEVLDDADGYRTNVAGGQTLRELTLTGSSKMTDSLEWRLEVRHDESNKDVFQNDKGAAKDTQNTIAVAAYYTF